MFKLYLFTFAFVTELGIYSSLEDCMEAGKKIKDDFRYDETLEFNLYCVEDNNRLNNIIY